MKQEIFTMYNFDQVLPNYLIDIQKLPNAQPNSKVHPFFWIRVSCPMLNPVPKSVHFLDYLNFWALFDFFLWSICWNLCNFELVICLLI